MKKQIQFVPIIITVALIVLTALSGCGKKETLLVEPDTGQALLTETGEPEASAEDRKEQETESKTAEEEGSCIVYVCGQVASPGVYTFPVGSRICDVFEAAGGMTPEAEESYWNQAELLTDGAMIYVPTKEEAAVLPEEERHAKLSAETSSGAEAKESGMTADGRVNLNTATKEQLMTIPGIGEAKAESILSYRSEQGGFSCAEDIMNISGIKEGMYAKIKDYISAGE